MRHLLMLTAGLSLVAPAAHAQIQPIQPIPGIPPIPGAKAASAPYKPFNSATAAKSPATPPSPYSDWQFSSAEEAKRQRNENAMPQAGRFSPEGEAKRAF
jgi:hypothetical protein